LSKVNGNMVVFRAQRERFRLSFRKHLRTVQLRTPCQCLCQATVPCLCNLAGFRRARRDGRGKKRNPEQRKRESFVRKFVSEQWILSCKSLGRSLAYHL